MGQICSVLYCLEILAELLPGSLALLKRVNLFDMNWKIYVISQLSQGCDFKSSENVGWLHSITVIQLMIWRSQNEEY